MKNVPKTFGAISKKMLLMVTQLKATRYAVIFDQYFSPSIKDYERDLRQESTLLDFNITGPDQVRPSDFLKELKNIHFKQAFVDFFIEHSISDEMVNLLRIAGYLLILNNVILTSSRITKLYQRKMTVYRVQSMKKLTLKLFFMFVMLMLKQILL